MEGIFLFASTEGGTGVPGVLPRRDEESLFKRDVGSEVGDVTEAARESDVFLTQGIEGMRHSDAMRIPWRMEPNRPGL